MAEATIRKPRGFSWAKFFKGDEPQPVERIHWQMLTRYKYGPMAECHPRFVSLKAPFQSHGRVTDDCPEKLHDLEIKFGNTLRNKGWAAAKKVYQEIVTNNRAAT